MSLSNHRSQRISLTVAAIALYSASAEERDTTDCFFVRQEMGAPPNEMKYPVQDRLVMEHPPQSASQ